MTKEERRLEKDEQGKDLVNQRKKERQKTMDKLSIDSSEAKTYDPDDEKCS